MRAGFVTGGPEYRRNVDLLSTLNIYLVVEHKKHYPFPLNAFFPVIQADAAVLKTSQMVLY